MCPPPVRQEPSCAKSRLFYHSGIRPGVRIVTISRASGPWARGRRRRSYCRGSRREVRIRWSHVRRRGGTWTRQSRGRRSNGDTGPASDQPLSGRARHLETCPQARGSDYDITTRIICDQRIILGIRSPSIDSKKSLYSICSSAINNSPDKVIDRSVALARVVRRIDISEAGRPDAMELDDGRLGEPGVMRHSPRSHEKAARLQGRALRLVELVSHRDVKRPRDYGHILIRRMRVRLHLVAGRHPDAIHVWAFLAWIAGNYRKLCTLR